MDRRRFVASLAAGGVAVTTGCLDALIEDVTTREATPATVGDDVLEATGYAHHETRPETDEEEVAGETVEVTSYVAEYVRSVDLSGGTEVEVAAVAALASPRVAIAGEEFNPIGEMDVRELTGFVRVGSYDLSIGDAVDERSAEILGTDVDVETFEGEASVEGDAPDGLPDTVAVHLDVARLDHDGDHLVVGGVYPQLLSGERDRVTAMIEGVEH